MVYGEVTEQLLAFLPSCGSQGSNLQQAPRPKFFLSLLEYCTVATTDILSCFADRINTSDARVLKITYIMINIGFEKPPFI